MPVQQVLERRVARPTGVLTLRRLRPAARGRRLTALDVSAAPVLAVKVLSPTTRRVDVTLKRSRCEAIG